MSKRRTSLDGARAFIRANTALSALPYIPEIKLHLAEEVHGLWRMTEAELEDRVRHAVIPVAAVFVT